MANVEETLKQSAVNRAAMIKRFGFVPLSILRLHRGTATRRLFHYGREQGKTTAKGARAERGGIYASRKLRYSGGGSRSGRAWSVMPAELPEFFIKYYTQPGAVYLDPFMGQGTQMQVAHAMGLHYYGYDISDEFFAYIAAVKERIDDGTTTLQITHGDSRFPDSIPDGVGDFCFTSPPYWDIEFYGPEPEQLGLQRTYADFIDSMEQVARAWLPKFKPDAWHVVNVNDFRKEGKLYPYHADTIALFQRAGWTLHDTWIIDGLVGGLPKTFAVDFNLQHVAPKTHEYALVFRAHA